MTHDKLTQYYDALVAHRNTRELTTIERLNLRVLEADRSLKKSKDVHPEPASFKLRIAVVSMLFNWPSTAGGIVHTAELARFLTLGGYEVCHFYAVNRSWQVGSVEGTLPYPSHALVFDDDCWSLELVSQAFRDAIDAFAPDTVIITDSWNSKPQLAYAFQGYKYFLRLAALECICPLNNVRLLIDGRGQPEQCRKSQLAHPQECRDCVERNENFSGGLQREERQFSRFFQAGYANRLQSAFSNAEGILVVNPEIAEICRPFAKAVHVIPSGFDDSRFEALARKPPGYPFRILFAGLVDEYMKGFHTLYEACHRLWASSQDFELHVTADRPSFDAPFIRWRGWQDQRNLPILMSECHIVVVPTLAQEALGRTAVEAMGASRAVIASNLGGLSYTIVNNVTGLLVEAGNADELARAIKKLKDDSTLADELGKNGRQRFEQEYTWASIIRTKYDPLFASIGMKSRGKSCGSH